MSYRRSRPFLVLGTVLVILAALTRSSTRSRMRASATASSLITVRVAAEGAGLVAIVRGPWNSEPMELRTHGLRTHGLRTHGTRR
jgi:hypothetical protein